MTSTQKKALRRYVLLAQAQREVGRELDYAERPRLIDHEPVGSVEERRALRDLLVKLDSERIGALSKVLRVYDDPPEQGKA